LAVSSRQGKRNNLLLLAAKELELTWRETITKKKFTWRDKTTKECW